MINQPFVCQAPPLHYPLEMPRLLADKRGCTQKPSPSTGYLQITTVDGVKACSFLQKSVCTLLVPSIDKNALLSDQYQADLIGSWLQGVKYTLGIKRICLFSSYCLLVTPLYYMREVKLEHAMLMVLHSLCKSCPILTGMSFVGGLSV
jgi:hypothetical protein